MIKKRLKYRKTLVILLVLLVFGLLEYRGVIWHNSLFASRYEVKGIDVSHFQGLIDWDRVSADSKWRFAYMKATEGMDMTDDHPKDPASLPPVIDIEIALDKDVDVIREQLLMLCSRLEAFYKKKPILYVTYDTFNTYIAGRFDDYEIWIMDIVKFPTLKGDRDWTFWQYNHRARIAGIQGFVDTNVFHGSQEDFATKYN